MINFQPLSSCPISNNRSRKYDIQHEYNRNKSTIRKYKQERKTKGTRPRTPKNRNVYIWLASIKCVHRSNCKAFLFMNKALVPTKHWCWGGRYLERPEGAISRYPADSLKRDIPVHEEYAFMDMSAKITSILFICKLLQKNTEIPSDSDASVINSLQWEKQSLVRIDCVQLLDDPLSTPWQLLHRVASDNLHNSWACIILTCSTYP